MDMHTTLVEMEIQRRIKDHGPITFREFMELALYFKDGGYYTASSPVWGEEGDYVTNLDTHPIFGMAIAKQMHEMWESLGRPVPFYLIEAGGGRGLLQGWVKEYMDEHAPKLARAAVHVMVERGGVGAGVKQGIKRVGSLAELKEELAEEGPSLPAGVIYSNELLDAIPFHRVVMRDGSLCEIYVGLNNNGNDGGKGVFKEIEGEPSTEALVKYFKDIDVTLPEGHKAEVSLGALSWIKEAAALIGKGFILTIDYGHPAKTLFCGRREGTLLCHFKHKTNDEPLTNVGKQDITAHVDFTSLMETGRSAGLLPVGYATQGNFLLGLGILDEVAALRGEGQALTVESVKLTEAVKSLVLPGGLGDTFKVFIQRKGAAEGTGLSGFSFKNIIESL